MRTDRPCRSDPELWFSTDKRQRGRNIHICLEHCTRLVECGELPAAAGAVQAGVLISAEGVAVAASKQPRPVSCDECLPTSGSTAKLPPRDTGKCGQPAGYNRHLRAGEEACRPCKTAHTAYRVARHKARRAA
jgi:hypothetical protein